MLSASWLPISPQARSARPVKHSQAISATKEGIQ